MNRPLALTSVVLPVLIELQVWELSNVHCHIRNVGGLFSG